MLFHWPWNKCTEAEEKDGVKTHSGGSTSRAYCMDGFIPFESGWMIKTASSPLADGGYMLQTRFQREDKNRYCSPKPPFFSTELAPVLASVQDSWRLGEESSPRFFHFWVEPFQSRTHHQWRMLHGCSKTCRLRHAHFGSHSRKTRYLLGIYYFWWCLILISVTGMLKCLE